MTQHWRALDAIAVSVYALAVTALAVLSLQRPAIGWDALGYTGAILALEDDDAARLHARSYGYLRAALPPEKFAQIATGGADANTSSYRQRVYADAHSFVQQIPFYAMRWLYIGPAYALYKAGLDPPTALVTVSTAAYVAIAALLLVWLAAHMPRSLAALLALLIAVNPLLLFVGRAPTPDALSTAVILWSLYFALERRRMGLCTLLLIASVFVRTDNVILAVMLLACFRFFGRDGRTVSGPAFALALAALAGAYLGVNAASDNYGWRVLFHHQFIALLANPADLTVALSLEDYLGALRRGLGSLAHSGAPSFILLGAVAYLLPLTHEHGRVAGVYDWILLLIGANMAIRFALFPVFLDRLFVVQYVMIVILLLLKTAHALGARAPAFARPYWPPSIAGANR